MSQRYRAAGNARHERCVVGEPSVHISYPLDRESTLAQRLLELGHAGVASSLESGRLLRDANVLGDPVADDAADAGEPEPDITGDPAADCGPAVGVVPAENDGGRPGEVR